MNRIFAASVLPFAILAVLAQASTCAAAVPRNSQDPGRQEGRVIGELTSIHQKEGRMTVKTREGDIVAVLTNDNTMFARVPPGEESLEKSTKIALQDLEVGDRIYARGRLDANMQSVQGQRVIIAQQVIAISKADIEKMNEKEREEWRTRSIAGVVVAVSPAQREITLQTPGTRTSSKTSVSVPDDNHLLRYAPDSINFSDAKPGSFNDIAVGDQIRALGRASSDGTTFKAEKLVSGSFRTIGGTVIDVNRDTREVKVRAFGDKEALVVVVKKASAVRRTLPQVVPLMIQKGLGSGGSVQPHGAATPSVKDTSSELQELIEQLPRIEVGELKPGDVIAVSGSVGQDRSRITAITI